MSVSSRSSDSCHGYPMGAVKLPSFKLTSKQAEEGKLELLVEDSRGNVFTPDVTKRGDDLFDATFLPSSPGDYVVSIRVDDEDIEGSPFNVKVFDPAMLKVINLQAALVNSTNTFAVSTAGLGQGPLVVKVTDLTTRQLLPVNVAQASSDLYKVVWSPLMAGFVAVSVSFAGVEAAGSPFKVEVVDPQLTTIALVPQLVPIQQKINFNLNTPTGFVIFNQIKVQIVDATGNQLETKLSEGRGGGAVIECVPFVAGPHKMDVTYFGKPIQKSPFSFNAFDASRVRILNWKNTGQVGQSLEFNVDILKAGPGLLDIKVSGGEVPYDIRETQAGKYTVKYTPKKSGAIEFNFTFNNIRIVGGPWICNVMDPPTASVTGNGVKINPPLPINQPTTFQVKLSAPITGDLDVQVIDPSGHSTQADLMSYQNLLYNYQYTPTSVGNYKIEVMVEGRPVAGSPFTSRTFSPGSIVISDVGSGFVGKTVCFYVDTSHAGEGDLEVLVEGGTVGCVCEKVKGQYEVTFTPREAKVHCVAVSFNNKPVRGSPLYVNVFDLDKVTLRGEYSVVPVNKVCNLRLNTVGAGNGHFCALAKAPSGAEITVQIKENNGRFLELEYTPREVGIHSIDLELERKVVPISPLQISAFDLTKIRVRQVKDALANHQTSILVESDDPGEGDLTFQVLTPNGGMLTNSIEQHSTSCYSILFTPLQQGTHQFVASFNGLNVIGSPFTFEVFDLSSIQVTGPCLQSFQCNKAASFFISSDSLLKCSSCSVKIIDPLQQFIVPKLTNVSETTVKVEFNGCFTGDHRIEIMVYGHALPSSPFIAKGWDVSKVSISPISHALVNVPSSFNISAKDAGEGTLEISISNQSEGTLPNHVTTTSEGQFCVNFTPVTHGPHLANITFNHIPVNGSPFSFVVHDPRKAVARGDGLEMIRANKNATFTVTCLGATVDDVNINITGPKNCHLRHRIMEQSEGQFKIDYTPILTGDHVIEVEVFGRSVPGSSFVVKCWDNSKVTCSKIITAKVGQQCSFNLNACNAGEGDMEIVVETPSGDHLANNVTSLAAGIFLVSMVPTEGGLHQVTVTFNQLHVPGSPFTFAVMDLSRVSVKGDALGFVKVNCNSTFTICAPGSTLKDLEVYIYAPNGKELNYNIFENFKDTFKVDFTPTIPGDHRIEVVYMGSSLACCPLFSRAYDPSKVIVCNVQNSCVNNKNTFELDVSRAGEGTVEIGVCDPNNNNIHNNVMGMGSSGRFQVTCTPQKSGLHQINVTFNKEKVPGSPFSFLAIDVHKVDVRDLTACRKDSNSSFFIIAPYAEIKDLCVTIYDEKHNEISSRVTEAANDKFKVDFTPLNTGKHEVVIDYFSQRLPSCPLTFQVFDPRKAKLTYPNLCRVNQSVCVKVDTSFAGSGELEAEVAHVNGRSVSCSINCTTPHQHEITFVPLEPGQHRLNVFMNKTHINDSPCTLLVVDPSRSGLRGQGASEVICNRSTSFAFTAPSANLHDLKVCITDCGGRSVPYRLVEGSDVFEVEYTPTKAGLYTIQVTHFGELIGGCPFTTNAFDPSLVKISPIRYVIVDQECSFNIDTSAAGPGEIEVTTKCDGTNNTARVTNMGNGHHTAFITALHGGTMLVTVNFNKHIVANCPFKVIAIDGMLASGDGPNVVMVGKVGTFTIHTNHPPVSSNAIPLNVIVMNERGQTVASNVSSVDSTSYRVEYHPSIAGPHRIEVRYAGKQIKGSPFVTQVIDVSQAVVKRYQQSGLLGKSYSFEVDTTKCGNVDGDLEIEIRGHMTQPRATVSSSRGVHHVSFVPSEAVCHNVYVNYCDEAVLGTPFKVEVEEGGVYVEWEKWEKVPINLPVCIEVTSNQSITCKINDPGRRQVPCKVEDKHGVYHIMLTPKQSGEHTVNIFSDKKLIDGCPFKMQVLAVERVKIFDATTNNCVGKESSFVVDCQEGGGGEVEVEVMCGNTLVPHQATPLSMHRVCYSFTPISATQHRAMVSYESVPVPGSPVLFTIIDPSLGVKLIPEQTILSAGDVIKLSVVGHNVALDEKMFRIEARGPRGNLVTTNKKCKLDGSLEVSVPTKLAGEYVIQGWYCGNEVWGSPTKCEVFDASSVQIIMPATSPLGSVCNFQVKTPNRGDDQLEVVVSDASSKNVACNFSRTNGGYQGTFISKSPGDHLVSVSFSGKPVMGSPFKHVVTDDRTISVSGPGISRAFEDQKSFFKVHTGGRIGDLQVEIKGPSGNVPVTPDADDIEGNKIFSYIPYSAGIHSMSVLFNYQHVMGSPFQVNVEGRKDDKMALVVNEEMITDFDCKGYRPEELKVLLRGPRGPCNVQLQQSLDENMRLAFVPPWEGEYKLELLHEDRVVNSRCGTAVRYWVPKVQPPPSHHHHHQHPFAVGDGLTSANVCDEASFEVVTSHDDDDIDVKISGMRSDIPVRVQRGFHGRFNCFYQARTPGVYMVSITCNRHPIPGSPFTLKVEDCQQATECSLVVSGIRGGVSHQQGSFSISGHFGNTAPRVTIWSEDEDVSVRLIKVSDEVYQASYTPKKAGLHYISVEHNDCNVEGSPFKVYVSCGADDDLYVEGDALHHTMPNQYSEFIIKNAKTVPLVQMWNTHHRSVAVSVEKAGETVYKCSYTVDEPGVYTLKVSGGCGEIRGSPFRVVAAPSPFDPLSIHLHGPGLHSATCKSDTHFFIDATRSYLTGVIPVVKVMGREGPVICHVETVNQGVFRAVYQPQYEGFLYITVTYASYSIGASPYQVLTTCPKQYPDIIVAPIPHVPHDVHHHCNEPCNHHNHHHHENLHNHHHHENLYNHHHHENLHNHHQFNSENHHHYNNFTNINKEILHVNQQPPVYLLGRGLVEGVVNEPTTFFVDSAPGYIDNLGVKVMSYGAKVPCQVSRIAPELFKCSYTPVREGVHQIFVKNNGVFVPGSPFQALVGHPRPEYHGVLMGNGLETASTNHRNIFLVDGFPSDDLHVDMHSRYGLVPIEMKVIDQDKSMFSYTPVNLEPHELSIKQGSMHVEGSPFNIKVINNIPPQSVVPSCTHQCSCHNNSTINNNIYSQNHNDNTNTNDLYNKNDFILHHPPMPFRTCPVHHHHHHPPHHHSPHHHHQPMERHVHRPIVPPIVTQTTIIPSQTEASMEPHLTTVEGLRSSYVHESAEFTIINAPDDPEIQLVSRDSDVFVRCFKIDDYTYRCSYIPTLPGSYKLHVKIHGAPIIGSPFSVEVDGPDDCNHNHFAYSKGPVVFHDQPVFIPEHSVLKPDPPVLIHDHPIMYPEIDYNTDPSEMYNHQVAHSQAHYFEAANGVPSSMEPPEPQVALNYLPPLVLPGSIVVAGRGLTSGVVGQQSSFTLRTPQRGKLSALLVGIATSVKVYCEETEDNNYNCFYTPEMPGSYLLNVTFNDSHINGSPFKVNVESSGNPIGSTGTVDASKVVVDGPGLNHGLLATFDSRFTIDTRGAGPGQLSCKMRGKKGTFKIEMKRDPTQNRLIHCSFNPTEVGEYILDTKWSGIPVPGSPHVIRIFDTQQQLNQFLSNPY